METFKEYLEKKSTEVLLSMDKQYSTTPRDNSRFPKALIDLDKKRHELIKKELIKRGKQ